VGAIYSKALLLNLSGCTFEKENCVADGHTSARAQVPSSNVVAVGQRSARRGGWSAWMLEPLCMM